MKNIKLENILKYVYPTNFVNKNSVPTLCIYGGDDSIIGIAHYSFLQQLSEQYGNKGYIEYISTRYAKYGYITAQLNHTYLNKKDKKCNIFKILDEITSCLESIKDKLKNLGFNENKLELAIGGCYSGAHLSLLYGYSIKNIPIPLKFLINIVGPLSLEPKFWCKLAKNVPTFDNIERKDIEKGIKEKKLLNFLIMNLIYYI